MCPEYSRRSALELGGALSLFALSGCTTIEHQIGTRSSPSDLSVGDSKTLEGGTVTVQSIHAQQMFVEIQAGVHPVVYGKPDTQYLIADVQTDGIEEPSQTVRSALHLSLNSKKYDASDRYLTLSRRDKATVSVAFPIPTPVDANSGIIVWEGESSGSAATWSLPQDALNTLAKPPDFSVTAFDVPEKATKGSSIEVAVTVENTGRSDGVFIAELGSTVVSDQGEIRIDVPRDESVTHRESLSLYGQAGSEETVILDWGSDHIERSVAIEDGSKT